MQTFTRLIIVIWHFLPIVLVAPLWFFTTIRPGISRVVRQCLERLGATFIKLGQIMSSRPDLVPPELITELSQLQDDAPAHSHNANEAILLKEFGKGIDQIFSKFDDRPIASGSIAQVHKATLLDGREVAVKIRHPGLDKTVGRDVAIIERLAGLVGMLPGLRWLDLAGSAGNFGETVRGQLDLQQEARNLHRFRAAFADVDYVTFPAPVDEWVSERVLVESFESGDSLRNILNQNRPYNKELARQGLHVFLRMIFREGFVHADMHPGNMLVREDENGHPHTIILDTGMVAELGERDLANYKDFFAAISTYDARKAAQLMIDNAPKHACEDPAAFGQRIDEIFNTVRDVPINQVEVAKVLGQVMQAVRKHKIQLEPAFTSVNVGIMVLEGVGRQLDPDLNILDVAGPVLLMMQQSAAS